MERRAVWAGLVSSGAFGIFAAGALSGCGGGGGGAAAPPAVPQAVSAATPSGLTATLAEDRSAVTASGRVAYTLTLTNGTGQPITFQTLGGCGVDAQREGAVVSIEDAAGTSVYPDSGSGCGAILINAPVTLAPGQSLSDSFVPPPEVFAAAGRHQATASFDIEAAGGAAFQGTRVGPLSEDVQ